ncbi:hypothetical protein FRC17_004641 [Serendipita sp. 399]|nr:hypothetical protein FRC17_004641 [Serendipita sp. 399]
MGPPTVEDEETSSPSASDSSSSVSDSESSSGNDEKEEAMDVDAKDGKGPSKGKQRSRSPSPANMDLPRGLPLEPKTDEEKRTDAQFRERFRKFWMASMAKSFGDELAELQKEPNMTKPKLSMLIDALAAGTNIYLPTTNDGSTTRIDEAEILLGLKK